MSRRTKKVGIAGRFGPRYGVASKKRWKEIMDTKNKKYPCPNCNHISVYRRGTSIWVCKKCGYTFAGAAYTPVIKRTVTGSEKVQ